MAWEGEGKVFTRNLALTLPLRGPLPLPPGAGEGRCANTSSKLLNCRTFVGV